MVGCLRVVLGGLAPAARARVATAAIGVFLCVTTRRRLIKEGGREAVSQVEEGEANGRWVEEGRHKNR